jgi:excinuclease ABC subunit C
METAAENLAFERAAALRDKIRAVETIGEKQKVFSATDEKNKDVMAKHSDGGKSCFTVLNVREGKLIDKVSFVYGEEEAPGEDFSEFLKAYYNREGEIPEEIYLSGPCEEEALIEAWLSSQKGRRVKIFTPQKGKNKALVEMAMKNAAEELRHETTEDDRNIKLLFDLKKLLCLPSFPGRIESFDISNLGAKQTVGGMVVFVMGRPSNKDYRVFKLNEQNLPDDYTAMKEMIYRRVENFWREEAEGLEKGKRKFSPLPDLILLDGGRACFLRFGKCFPPSAFPSPCSAG